MRKSDFFRNDTRLRTETVGYCRLPIAAFFQYLMLKLLVQMSYNTANF